MTINFYNQLQKKSIKITFCVIISMFYGMNPIYAQSSYENQDAASKTSLKHIRDNIEHYDVSFENKNGKVFLFYTPKSKAAHSSSNSFKDEDKNPRIILLDSNPPFVKKIKRKPVLEILTVTLPQNH